MAGNLIAKLRRMLSPAWEGVVIDRREEEAQVYNAARGSLFTAVGPHSFGGPFQRLSRSAPLLILTVQRKNGRMEELRFGESVGKPIVGEIAGLRVGDRVCCHAGRITVEKCDCSS